MERFAEIDSMGFVDAMESVESLHSFDSKKTMEGFDSMDSMGFVDCSGIRRVNCFIGFNKWIELFQ